MLDLEDGVPGWGARIDLTNPVPILIIPTVKQWIADYIKALEWARKNGLRTVALVGAKRGRMAEIAEQVLVINDTHYGRVEDAQMGICHMLCYAFIEHPEWAK